MYDTNPTPTQSKGCLLIFVVFLIWGIWLSWGHKSTEPVKNPVVSPERNKGEEPEREKQVADADKSKLTDNTSLPVVSGRQLKVNVHSQVDDVLGGYISGQNEALKSVKCVAAAEGQLVIDFDIDDTHWREVGWPLPLLVRLFDKNGQYLTHFTTAEKFGVIPLEVRYVGVLLKPKGNRLIYTVNIRDLRDASIAEIGFYRSSR